MKNLKKGLAVAMSLAMIATVMPTMNVNAAVPACTVETTNNAKDLLYAIAADLGENKLKDLSIDAETITWTKTLIALKKISASASDITLTDKKLETLLAADGGKGTSILDYITAYVDCDGGNDVAKLLAGVKDDGATTRSILAKVDALDTALAALETGFNDENGTYLNGIPTSENDTTYKDIKATYDTIDTLYATFKGNIATATKDDNQEIYDNFFTDMKTALEEYEDSFIGDFIVDFVENLKEEPIYTGGSLVKEVINPSAEISFSELAKLETFVKDLKDDKKDLGDLEFSKVSDEDEVVEIVEALEDVIADMKDVKELLKSTSKTVKDYKGLKADINALATAALAYSDSTADTYDEKFNALRADEITKLTTYMDDVVSNFYEVEAIKRTSGNYTLRLKDAGYARYATDAEIFGSDINFATLLTTNIVKDEEESVYDALTENQSETDKLMAAITAVENIRIGSSFTTAEATKIVAAKKAYTTMTDGSGAIETPYTTLLTAKEKRTVKANADLIEALYFKLMLTGTITESGWIDLGNGNWDYINADGSKSTKWVAAGKDWYFVQAGHMLRNSWVAQDATGAVWYYVDGAGKMVVNTTIDGYVINANGEWHKK